MDPDAWLDLIAPPDASELRAALRALKAELAQRPFTDPPVAQRLASLRRALAARGVDGMILPLTDEHRSEYIPASAMRLTWLTGFTGSAGIVAVLPERAAMFVDGRYTLQAEAQLDPALFERCHVIERPPAAWLGEHLRAGQRLGFDPNLHVKAEVERYRRACLKAGAELVALADNPIDAIWESRPPAPIAPITLLDDAYAGEASADKRARIGAEVGKAGAEVAVLSAPDSIAWLLNLRGGDIPFNPLTLSFALLHADGAVELFVDQRKLAPGQSLGNGVSIQPIAGFAAGLEQLGKEGRRVLVDPASTSVGVTDRLGAAGALLIEADEPCVLPKACKNPTEIEGARHAQRRDGAALCRFLCWLEAEAVRRPVTEQEAADRLERERKAGPALSRPQLRDDLGRRPEQRARPLSRHAREQPHAGGGLALPRRFRRAVPRRHHRRHPHGRDRRGERRDATALHPGAQGPHRAGVRALPAGRQRRPARRPRAGGRSGRPGSSSTTAPGMASAAICACTRGRPGSPRHRPWRSSPA